MQVKKLTTQIDKKTYLKFLTALFLLLMTFSGIWAFNIHQELNWPETDGVVVKQQTAEEYGEYRYVYVRYKFLVNETTFYCTEQIGQFKPPKLEEIEKQYDEGKKVRIRYNPSNPTVCAIESDSNPTILHIVLGIAGLMFIAALITIGLQRKV